MLLLRPGVVRGLLTLLSQSHLKALLAWPKSCGGGSPGAQSLSLAVVSLLNTPFRSHQLPEATLMRLLQVWPAAVKATMFWPPTCCS